MPISDRIAKIRKHYDITMEEFGRPLGVGKSTVSTWESGRSSPGAPTIKLIALNYHINPQWLETGEGTMLSEELDESKIDTMFANSDEFVRSWMKSLLKMSDAAWDAFKKQVEAVDQIRNERKE